MGAMGGILGGHHKKSSPIPIGGLAAGGLGAGAAALGAAYLGHKGHKKVRFLMHKYVDVESLSNCKPFSLITVEDEKTLQAQASQVWKVEAQRLVLI